MGCRILTPNPVHVRWIWFSSPMPCSTCVEFTELFVNHAVMRYWLDWVVVDVTRWPDWQATWQATRCSRLRFIKNTTVIDFMMTCAHSIVPVVWSGSKKFFTLTITKSCSHPFCRTWITCYPPVRCLIYSPRMICSKFVMMCASWRCSTAAVTPPMNCTIFSSMKPVNTCTWW